MKWIKLTIGTIFLGIMIYGCNPSCLFNGNIHDIRIPFQIQPHQSTYSVGDTIDLILEMDQYYSETTEQFYEIENSVISDFNFVLIDSLSSFENLVAMDHFNFLLDTSAHIKIGDRRSQIFSITSEDAQKGISYLSRIIPQAPGLFALYLDVPDKPSQGRRYDIDGDGCNDGVTYSVLFNPEQSDGSNRSLVEKDTSFLLSLGFNKKWNSEDILSLTNVYYFEVVE